MIKDVIAYYESVGPHWLCSPRKARAKHLLGACTVKLESAAVAEPLLKETKRVCQKELGPTHMSTLQSMGELSKPCWDGVCVCMRVCVCVCVCVRARKYVRKFCVDRQART